MTSQMTMIKVGLGPTSGVYLLLQVGWMSWSRLGPAIQVGQYIFSVSVTDRAWNWVDMGQIQSYVPHKAQLDS